jgi:hypothetical protein
MLAAALQSLSRLVWRIRYAIAERHYWRTGRWHEIRGGDRKGTRRRS